jgi:hypothetical protein
VFVKSSVSSGIVGRHWMLPAKHVHFRLSLCNCCCCPIVGASHLGEVAILLIAMFHRVRNGSYPLFLISNSGLVRQLLLHCAVVKSNQIKSSMQPKVDRLEYCFAKVGSSSLVARLRIKGTNATQKGV